MSEDTKKIVSKEQLADADEILATFIKTKKIADEALSVSPKTIKDPFKITDENIEKLSNRSLKEIVEFFQHLIESNNLQVAYKYADTVKASFYKALKREKIDCGFTDPAVDSTIKDEDKTGVSINPFAEVEKVFKELYTLYKSRKSEYLAEMDKQREANYKVKLQVIEEIKKLVEAPEDLHTTFNAFRELQAKWRKAGPVPQDKNRAVYEEYQKYNELFYDFVKINNEYKDLDLKKNLESKTLLCIKAEQLVNIENVVSAFNTLQNFHEEWKEIGPVDKEHREVIWERFKAATSIINKKHQAHFEELKEQQKENLLAKTVFCEKAEVIANMDINDSLAWNKYSKEMIDLQKEWKSIGFATKKDNQKIYDRFRVACDHFYDRKRAFYSRFKEQMAENMLKKINLCEKVEALKDSVEWKKTTDQLINLQKEWKNIGPVSRKKSDQIWKRFRAACDTFFDNKEKNFGGVDVKYVENLHLKESILEEIKAIEDATKDKMRDIISRWNKIGFVPFKVKDKIQKSFNEIMSSTFEGYQESAPRSSKRKGESRGNSERDKLMQKFRKKESEIQTYENNMGFFANSKNANALLDQLKEKINLAKEELKELEEKIKSSENQD
ncbi:MAG: DUF349 domain-containing protein [Bacteroidales bacterium]